MQKYVVSSSLLCKAMVICCLFFHGIVCCLKIPEDKSTYVQLKPTHVYSETSHSRIFNVTLGKNLMSSSTSMEKDMDIVEAKDTSQEEEEEEEEEEVEEEKVSKATTFLGPIIAGAIAIVLVGGVIFFKTHYGQELPQQQHQPDSERQKELQQPLHSTLSSSSISPRNSKPLL
jgi:hypothetical protein